MTARTFSFYPPLALHAVTLILIFLFTYTGISKIMDHHFFYAQLQVFPWLGGAALIISWLVPVVEIIVVGMLLFPVSRLWGLYSSLILLLTFSSYLTVMIYTNSNLPCSCGGIISTLSWKQHIILNILLLLMAVLAIFIEKSSRNLRSDMVT